MIFQKPPGQQLGGVAAQHLQLLDGTEKPVRRVAMRLFACSWAVINTMRWYIDRGKGLFLPDFFCLFSANLIL